jgi:hypothetical protein
LLRGGGGADIFRYRTPSESSGTNFDRLEGFDWREDRIDLLNGFSGWTGDITLGALNAASFDADLAAAVDAPLESLSAVLFRPDSGDHAGASSRSSTAMATASTEPPRIMSSSWSPRPCPSRRAPTSSSDRLRGSSGGRRAGRGPRRDS